MKVFHSYKSRTKNFSYTKQFSYIAVFSLVTTLVVWMPFIMRVGEPASRAAKYGFEGIYRNYDGLMFVIPAKTNYRSDQIEKYKVLDLKPIYYAAHTPGYPIIIKILAPMMGYLESMIYINLVASMLMGCLLYLFYKNIFEAKNALTLTFVTLLLPRFWILRSTGSSEIVFMCCLLASAILLNNKHYIWAGIFAAYASFTRIHGVLWGGGVAIYYLYLYLSSRKNNPKLLWIILGSFGGFLTVCLLYLRQYGDFFAYFHTGAVVPSGFFYSQFESSAKEIKTFFLEDLLFYFGAIWLYLFDKIQKKKDALFFFVIVYFGFILTVQHRDLARYLVPIVPVIIGSAGRFLEQKQVRWMFLAILPALYWYVVNFISSNMFLDSMLPFM